VRGMTSLGLRMRDERGVSAAIVVVTLTVLLGMLALSIDIGFLAVKKRAMVRASDSAALAFAESCVRSDIGTPDAQADALAVKNVGNAVRVGPAAWPVTGTCSPGSSLNAGKVTVNYSGESGSYFGGILGVGQEHASATSTAVWGPALATNGVTPFMLTANRLSSCTLIPNPTPGTDCWFYQNNGDIGNAQWGMVNTQADPSLSKWGWNVPSNYNSCPTYSTSELLALLANGAPFLPMGNPDTYVCTVTGQHTPVWNAFQDFESLPDTDPNKIKLFPINDSTRQVSKTGGVCTPAMMNAGTCNVDKYDIVGFAALRLQGVYNGNDSDWPAECKALAGPKGQKKDPNAWCFHAVWINWYSSSGPPCANCDTFGREAVGLLE
jgi:Flp pilus assembly protein TadG